MTSKDPFPLQPRIQIYHLNILLTPREDASPLACVLGPGHVEKHTWSRTYLSPEDAQPQCHLLLWPCPQIRPTIETRFTRS
jgi:hypothetical protein